MSEARVPAWFMAIGNQTAADRVYELFRDVLAHLPMSSTELAQTIGVSQPAVSRWANDSAHPSLEEMAAVLQSITQKLRETEIVVARSANSVALVLEAVKLHTSVALDPESQQNQSLAEIRGRLNTLLRSITETEDDSTAHPVMCCAAFPCIFASDLDIYPQQAAS